jgi:hypothetical protein
MQQLNIHDPIERAVQFIVSIWLKTDDIRLSYLDTRLVADLGADPFEVFDDIADAIEDEFSIDLGRDCDLRNPDKADQITIGSLVRAVRKLNGIPFLGARAA